VALSARKNESLRERPFLDIGCKFGLRISLLCRVLLDSDRREHGFDSHFTTCYVLTPLVPRNHPRNFSSP
jgi:hypothetical protein